MVVTRKVYSEMLPTNHDCMRPIGGRCIGNCRTPESNNDCLRPIGGRCIGNCRKPNNNNDIKW